MRKGFTLIEMMISVVILSIMMLFLYQSYSSLNQSNKFYEIKTDAIKDEQLKKRVIYMDFTLATLDSVKILNQDKYIDIVFLQSSHSLHRKHNPYIAYIAKDEKLYRLESLRKFDEYPLDLDVQFVVDYMGEIEEFRVYQTTEKSEDQAQNSYLVNASFKNENDILLKIKGLNDY